MNDRDYNNLQFLLTSSEDVIADWFLKTSVDDIEYAMQIMLMAGEEMRAISSEIHDENETFEEANAVLSRFRL